MSDTPLLGLPLIAAAQAQKHVTHNEALLALDALIQLSVVSRSLASPPAAADGERYLVAAPGQGAWAGQQGRIALAQGGGFTFITPRKGWRMWVEAEEKLIVFDGTAWRDVAAAAAGGGGGGSGGGGAPPDLSNIPKLGVNATADEVNRLAVASGATLFTHAGSDHRFKLNKNAAADTASLLYQTGWSGRAEMGLTGSDDFRINVSADGAAWLAALVIDRTTGAVSLPNTPVPSPPAPPAPVLYAQSLAAQGPGFAADTYLAGSGIALPAARLRPGTRYVLSFDATKTLAGIAAPVLTLRLGAGAAGDASLGQMNFPAQTLAVDDGRFSLEVTFRSVGSAAVVQAVAALTHSLATTGLANVPGPVRRLTSAPFNASTDNLVLGVSLNAGALAAWTVSLVQARLENLS